jgi:hypothetical protein
MAGSIVFIEAYIDWAHLKEWFSVHSFLLMKLIPTIKLEGSSTNILALESDDDCIEK